MRSAAAVSPAWALAAPTYPLSAEPVCLTIEPINSTTSQLGLLRRSARSFGFRTSRHGLRLCDGLTIDEALLREAAVHPPRQSRDLRNTGMIGEAEQEVCQTFERDRGERNQPTVGQLCGDIDVAGEGDTLTGKRRVDRKNGLTEPPTSLHVQC